MLFNQKLMFYLKVSHTKRNVLYTYKRTKQNARFL